MPVNKNYPIYGKVFDGASNLLSGVTVNLINTSNAEQLATADQGETTSVGEFAINAESLTTSVTDTQTYEVVFSKDGYETFKVAGTFNFAKGTDEIIIDLMRVGTKTDHFEKDDVHIRIAQHKLNYHIWANNKLGSGSLEVLKTGGAGKGKGVHKTTFPGIDLHPGQVCYVHDMKCKIRTASKTSTFEVIKCTGASGSGTVKAVSPETYLSTAANVQTREHHIIFDIPIRIKYGSTAHSVGVRINTSDNSTYVDVELEGYVLEE